LSISGHDDPINGHYDESASATNKKEMSTWKYELKREQTSSKSQQFIGYHHSSRRIYKRYTVVLTSDWDVREPEIEIEKVDKNNKNKKLAGARFSIKATVTGEDIHKNQVDRIVYFNGIKTDRKGIAKITTADFEQKGILLYLIYGLGYLISNKSFYGVFIIEVAFFTIFLYFVSKIVRLFLNSKFVYIIFIFSS